MCGIVGIMNFEWYGITKNHDDIFREMLYCDAVRGMHGTGCFAVDEVGNLNFAKVGGPPHQLFGSQPFRAFDEFVRKRYIRFMVGHNRYATKGKHITEHAHPFRHGHITLVHNGTLENYHQKYDVDSEYICAAIAEEGAENVIPKLSGAWTLVWWDSKLQKLNILRNEERPLFIASNDKEKSVIFCSEEDMLSWIMHRNWLYETAKIEEVTADTLFSWDLKSKIIEPDSTPLKGKPSFKSNKAYFETLFKEAAEACANTSCAPVQDVEIVKETTTTGDWQRGKTGAVHLPVVYSRKSQSKKPKVDNTNKASWRAAHFIHDICKDDFISVRIVDFDIIDEKVQDHYTVRCSSDDYPDIEFKCNVKGETLMDKLYYSKFGLRAKVFQIMKSDQPPAVNPHRVFLHDPIPVDIWTPKSSGRAPN